MYSVPFTRIRGRQVERYFYEVAETYQMFRRIRNIQKLSGYGPSCGKYDARTPDNSMEDNEDVSKCIRELDWALAHVARLRFSEL